MRHEDYDLLLFNALTEIAAKFHWLKTDERFYSYEVKHLALLKVSIVCFLFQKMKLIINIFYNF